MKRAPAGLELVGEGSTWMLQISTIVDVTNFVHLRFSC